MERVCPTALNKSNRDKRRASRASQMVMPVRTASSQMDPVANINMQTQLEQLARLNHQKDQDLAQRSQRIAQMEEQINVHKQAIDSQKDELAVLQNQVQAQLAQLEETKMARERLDTMTTHM